MAAYDFEQLIARKHKLRNHGHKMFERIKIDADRLISFVRVIIFACRIGNTRLGNAISWINGYIIGSVRKIL